MRSLSTVVDQLAAEKPHGLWAKIPGPQNDEADWQDVTWLQFAQAVDAMAHWMDYNLGPGMENETVAYIGINDIRYVIVMMAAMKAGYKALFTSPRSSEEGQLSLLSLTKCSKLLHSEEFQTQVNGWAAKCEPLQLAQIPDLKTLLQARPRRVPYQGRSQENEQETILILHSSGTTGLPKPVHIKAGALAVIDGIKQMPAPQGRRNMHDELYTPKLMVSMMPFFHIMGIVLLARSIYHQGPLVLPPGGKPVTADLMMKIINQTKPSAAAFVPSILEDICNTSNGLETLGRLEYAFYGGAPLARTCGDKISKVTNLQVCIGSTETLNAPSYIPNNKEDWEFFEWSAESGIAMEATSDNLYEMIIKRTSNREYQSVFFNFSELQEWRTKDLFEEHPSKPGLWRYRGRIDDMLILSNGEKVTPVSFEKSVEGHPLVKGALVVGSARFQAGLILEPQTDQWLDSGAFIDQVWPWIEKANEQCPSHAQVWRWMVAMAAPEKPFKRAPKGSVMRHATYQLYEAEINALYSNQALEGCLHDIEVDDRVDLTKVKSLVRKTFQCTLHQYREDATDDMDVFLLGIDSLQVIQLSKVLSRMSRKLSPNVGHDICPPRKIYRNPSVDQLSRAIIKEVENGDSLGKDSSETAVSREEKISAMIWKYTKHLPKPTIKATARPSKHTVILTGSTGSLGTYLLQYLLENEAIERIYCLNRSTDAASRQEQPFRKRDLNPEFTAKVEFLTTNFGRDRFGLSPAKYLELQQSVDIFLHNAWPVNFNMALEHFEEAHIAGTRRCVDFSAEARHHPHIVFVSSIASVGNWFTVRDNDEEIPEVFFNDNSLPLKQGYAESKHVASCILAHASRVSGVNATIIRTGQLAGPAAGKGLWNKQEWLPSLIATSRSMGKIPCSLGSQDTLNWVPVDSAAKSVLDVVFSRITDKSRSTTAADSGAATTSPPPRRRHHHHLIVSTSSTLTSPTGAISSR